MLGYYEHMRSKITHWFSLIFKYPTHSLSLEEDSYDEYWQARGKNTPSLSVWQKKRADIANRCMSGENLYIVDVGSGSGEVLDYFREKRKGLTGLGIDASDHALLHVKNFGFEVSKQEFSEVENLLVPENDYVLLFEIIEHIKDSEKLVIKALQSARKGIFISIPNTGFFPYRLRLLFGSMPVQWVKLPNEHLRFWTLKDVKWWIKALGLESRSQVYTYEGFPILRHVLPGVFAAGIVIYIKS